MITRKILLPVILIFVLIAAALGLQFGLRAAFSSLKSYVALQLESSLQEEFSYEMFLLQNITTVGVRNASLSPDRGDGPQIAQARNILVQYRLFSLLRGRPSEALKTIHLQQLQVDLSPSTTASLGDQFAQIIQGAVTGVADSLPAQFAIKGSDVSLNWQLANSVIRLDDINFVMNLNTEGENYLQGDARAYYALHKDAKPIVQTRITYTLMVNEDFSDGWGEIVLDEAEVGPLRFALQRYAFAIKDRAVELVKTSTSLSALSVQAGYAEGNLSLEVDMDRLNLDDLILGTRQAWMSDRLAENYYASGNFSLAGAQLSYQMDLTVESEDATEELTVLLAGDQATVLVDQLFLRYIDGSANFQGEIDVVDRVPTGNLQLRQFRFFDAMPSLSGSLRLYPHEGGVKATGNAFQVEKSRIDYLSLHVLQQDPDWQLQILADMGGGSLDATVDIGPGQAAVAFSVQEVSAASLLNAIVQVPEPVYSLLPTDILVNMEGQAAMQANELSELQLSALVVEQIKDTLVPITTIAVQQVGAHVLSANMSANEFPFFLDLMVDWQNIWASTGILLVGTQRLSLQAQEISATVKQIIFADEKGSSVAKIDIDISKNDGIDAILQTEELILPLFSFGLLNLSTQMNINYRPSYWNLEIDRVLVAMDDFQLQFSGKLGSQQGGRLTEVVFADQYAVLTGDVVVQMADGALQEIDLRLSDAEDSEKVTLALISDEDLSASITLENILAARTGWMRQGTINLSAELSDLLGDIEARASIQYRQNSLASVAVSSDINWAGRLLQLRNIQGTYFSHKITAPSILISTIDHRMVGNVLYENTSEDSRTIFTIVGSIDPSVTSALNAFQQPFSISARATRYQDNVRQVLGLLQLDRSTEFLTLTGENISSSLIYRIEDGIFRLNIDEAPYVALRAQGLWLDQQFDMDLTLDYFSVHPFSPLSTMGWVDFYEGIVSGSLQVSANGGNLDIRGELIGRELQASTVFSPTPLGPADLRLVFLGDRAELAQTFIPNGDGIGSLAADFGFSGPRAGKFSLTILSTDPLGLHIKYPFGALYSEGYASGVVQISSDGSQTIVTGDIAIRYATFSFDPGAPMLAIDVLDMRVTSDKAVSFIWPNAVRPIIQWIAFPDQQIRITMDESAGQFNVAGKVDFRSGDIYYFNRLFTLYSGNIDFGSQSLDFDPRVSLRAGLQTSGISGDVTIYMIAENQRIGDFSPRFESDPPLAIADIVQTLGSNLVEGGSLSGYYQLSDALVTAVSYSRGLSAIRELENNARNAFNLDVLSIRSEFAQNVLRSVLTTASADESIPRYTFADYLNNTSLTIGKYIGGRDIFLELRVKLSADADPLEPITTLRPDASFRMEWNTPFFFFEWFFFPRNVESLFIEDHGFSLSWKANF